MAEVVIAKIDTDAMTVTLRDKRVWPITLLFGPPGFDGDPDEADVFVAGRDGEGWISERFSDFVDQIV